MSLYRYVPGKEELLDLMLERVNAPRRGRAARRRLARRHGGRWAASLWTALHHHPWLPLVDQTRPLLGPNALRGMDIAVAALDGHRADRPGAGRRHLRHRVFVVSAARNHNSAALAEQATGVSHEEFWAAQEPVLSKAMQSGDFPYVAALDMDAFDMGGEEFMVFGLTRLLDGVAVLVEGRTAPG